MSYAGPANPKNPATSVPTIRRITTTPASHVERNTAFIAGVLVGAAVGAGVALLLAPQSGRTTRRRLVRSGRDLSQRGRDAWHDVWHDTWHDLAHEFRLARRRLRAHAATNADRQSANRSQRRSFNLRAASSL